MCGMDYFQLFHCTSLYCIVDTSTPGSLSAVTGHIRKQKKHLQTQNYITLPYITINIPINHLLYFVHAKSVDSQDVNVRQPLKLATMDRHRSGQPINNCGMTAL